MTDEVFASIVGGLVQVIGGAVFGFWIARLTIKWQRGRKVIEYENHSVPLLQIKPNAKRKISFQVDKSVITGKDDDKGVSWLSRTSRSSD